MIGSSKGREPPLRTLPARGFITIKYIIHTVYIDIYINYNNYSIKNYYVNSYLTTCMAQSIKLVSCNNNNKDTTIYLLVSLSRVSIHIAYYSVLIYSYILLVFFCFFFFPTGFLCLRSPCYYTSPRIRLRIQFLFADRKDWKFQISIGINHFFSVLYHCNI